MLKNLVDKCPRIHTLTISVEVLKSEKFSEALSRLQHLCVLKLQKDYTENISVLRPGVLRPLGDGCPQLAEIDFGWLDVNVDDLRYFVNGKRNTLKSIRINSALGGNRSVLPLLTVCADKLERLKLYECSKGHGQVREAFTALGTLKNLQELSMSVKDPLLPGTNGLAFKTGGVSKLRLLDLGGPYLDNDALIAVSRGCPALRKLVLRECDWLSDAASSQIHRLEHLEVLDVWRCGGLGGDFIPCLVGLPRLHTLVIENTNFMKLQPGLGSILELSSVRCLTFDYSVVTEVPFDKFPGKLVNLRVLKIQKCLGDPKATDGLTEQIPGLEIHGSIEAVEPVFNTDVSESDTECEDEEEEEDYMWPSD